MVKLIKLLDPLVYRDYKRKRVIKIGLYECYCGNEFKTRVRKNLPITCGCIIKTGLNKTHNMSKNNKVYNTWLAMKSRCLNINSKDYKNYGGRNITIQENWITNFKDFYEYMGEKPFKRASLDRIDVNGNYVEGNVKWSNDKEQANNKRNNKKVEFLGQTKNLSEWEEELGINQNLISARLIKGWSIEKALTTQPVTKKH